MYNKFEILLVVFMPNIKPILILTSRVKTICTRYDISDYMYLHLKDPGEFVFCHYVSSKRRKYLLK